MSTQPNEGPGLAESQKWWLASLLFFAVFFVTLIGGAGMASAFCLAWTWVGLKVAERRHNQEVAKA